MFTATILADNQISFLAALAKLGRRAAKLGLAVPVAVCGAPRLAERANRRVAVVDVEISGGDLVQIEGWTMVALLCHEMRGANVVRLVSGASREEWRTMPSACEHCGTKRARKDTAILQHEDGRQIQIGKSCLVDFLGARASDLAARAAYVAELREINDLGMSSGGAFADPEDFLATVAACIRVEGWISRARAEQTGRMATLTLAQSPRAPLATDEDEATARAALVWARDLEARSDYEHNIKTIARAGALRSRDLGYAASIVAAFQRAQAPAQAPISAVSQHVGQIGEKIETEVTILRVVEIDGNYGVSRMHVMQDASGNVLVWFASGRVSFDVGATVKITATVKNHNERQGVSQTIVTRAKAA